MTQRVTRVELERVTKRFGATVALREASAVFESGALSVVVGANGSGKSTLLGILGTTVKATSGVVRFAPYEVDDSSVRGEIGWLSHEALVYPDLSGEQNLRLAAEFYGLDPDMIWTELKERFQLRAFAERPLRTNSRGQKQRVALARALMHRPSLVLLDEPTTGLDTAGLELLLEAVSGVIADAVVVVVAHDPNRFDALKPVLWEMDRGTLRRAR